MSNKIGVLGGTFDPIHLGHLITAQSVLEQRNLRKIIFIPCNISPHKTVIKSAPPQHRLKMLSLALEDYPDFEFSSYEIDKGDVSYTLDTLLELKKTYSKIELIIGFDNLITFDTWREPDKILELADLVVMKRSSDIEIKKAHKYFGEAIYVQTPTIEISSTEIRRRIKQNMTITNLVPDKVKEYIFEHKLYENN